MCALEDLKHSKILLAAALRGAKATYYRTKVSELKGNCRALFELLNGPMQRSRVSKMPQQRSPEDLAETSWGFFHEKVSSIRASLCPRAGEQTFTEKSAESVELDHFRPTSSDEIKALILASPNK